MRLGRVYLVFNLGRRQLVFDGLKAPQYLVRRQPIRPPFVFRAATWIGAVILVGGGFLSLNSTWLKHAVQAENNALATTNLAFTPAPATVTPTSSPKLIFTQPQRLQIPAVHVDAMVTSVGLEKNGALGTPAQTDQAGWYKDGAVPGDTGSAVLVGHLDDSLARPAVFWPLKDLKVDDPITVTDSDGQRILFHVTKLETFNFDQLPFDTLFRRNDKSYLNLITCQGQWDWQKLTYTKRLVVFAEAD